MRFPHTLVIIRPTLGSDGDWTFPAGTEVQGILFRVKRRVVLPGQGDVGIVDAQAFVPSGTDVRLEDRVTRGQERFVVTRVIQGEDDKGNTHHVGLLLRDSHGEVGIGG